MPPILTPQKLGQVVLESVEHGAYPDSENVASAHLPQDALPSLLAGIERAQNEVKVGRPTIPALLLLLTMPKTEIRSLSRDAAPDIDGWIAQAKQLQADIERSRATAHDIVQQAEAGKTLHANVDDASSKATLLKNELAFNDTLQATLERIKQASDLLDKAQDATVEQNIIEALDTLKMADDYIVHLGPFRDTRVAAVLHKRASQLRDTLAGSSLETWNLLIAVDVSKKCVTIKNEADGTSEWSSMTCSPNLSIEATGTNLPTVVDALSRLGTLDAAIAKLQKALEQAIVHPRLVVRGGSDAAGLQANDDTLEITRGVPTPSVVATIDDIHIICGYLSKRLPTSISMPLSEKLLPSLVSRLTSDWLDASIPVALDGLDQFQDVLSSVSGLAGYIEELGWASKELNEWVEKAPRNWLARRKEDALASVRDLCSRGIQHKKEVERVETQMVSRDDAIMAGEDAEEDWDAWDNDDGEKASEATSTEDQKEESQHAEEEDMDADAWGLDDDAEADNSTEAKSEKGSKGNAEEEDAEAWGWGDEDAGEDPEAAEKKSEAVTKEPLKKTNAAKSQQSEHQERELTLRETYTVTEIPDAIMEIIAQVVSDAQALARPK